jgi:hypothetical protein
MFNIKNELKERKLKDEHEKRLKKALSEKCADIGSEYASHQEDETEYTVVTINGETLKVRKEEITIQSLTDHQLKHRKY